MLVIRTVPGVCVVVVPLWVTYLYLSLRAAHYPGVLCAGGGGRSISLRLLYSAVLYFGYFMHRRVFAIQIVG